MKERTPFTVLHPHLLFIPQLSVICSSDLVSTRPLATLLFQNWVITDSIFIPLGCPDTTIIIIYLLALFCLVLFCFVFGIAWLLSAQSGVWGPPSGSSLEKQNLRFPHQKLHFNRMPRGSPGKDGQRSTGPGWFPSHSCSLHSSSVPLTGCWVRGSPGKGRVA